MNHCYRLVFSRARAALVPAAEIVGSASRKSTPRRRAVRRARTGPRAAIAATLALLLGAAPMAVLALPNGARVVHGHVRIDRVGHKLTVQQDSDKAILNWKGFNAGADESVDFQQPGADSAALNRVVGDDASRVYGRIHANGQIFLVNPNGIFFAPGARVDAAGVIASTLNIANADFLAGHYSLAGDSDAAVVNQGRITASRGGTVALIGRRVDNQGTIQTPGGATALGAGSRVDMTLAGIGPDPAPAFRIVAYAYPAFVLRYSLASRCTAWVWAPPRSSDNCGNRV